MEFRVYAGPTEGNGEVAYAGLPTVDAGGIYRAEVQIDEIEPSPGERDQTEGSVAEFAIEASHRRIVCRIAVRFFHELR
jgi:hypothetical protein